MVSGWRTSVVSAFGCHGFSDLETMELDFEASDDYQFVVSEACRKFGLAGSECDGLLVSARDRWQQHFRPGLSFQAGDEVFQYDRTTGPAAAEPLVVNFTLDRTTSLTLLLGDGSEHQVRYGPSTDLETLVESSCRLLQFEAGECATLGEHLARLRADDCERIAKLIEAGRPRTGVGDLRYASAVGRFSAPESRCRRAFDAGWDKHVCFSPFSRGSCDLSRVGKVPILGERCHPREMPLERVGRESSSLEFSSKTRGYRSRVTCLIAQPTLQRLK